MAIDSLGDRMKRYELTYQHRLLDRMYTIIRIDGKAFHTYTRKLPKPFDRGIIEDMIETTQYLCENVQGCKVGYVQSDEITLILTDFEELNTMSWFDNEVQKMCSISASLATAKFNQLRMVRELNKFKGQRPSEDFSHLMDIRLAQFDSRVFQVPTLSEVYNNLLWRNQDCVRNSIASSAQSIFSSKELHGKNTTMMQEMIATKTSEFKRKIEVCGYEDAI
jgi:tRNA(His) guanylyltransferase